MGKAKKQESLDELRVRARNEFNITNADVMSEEQLRAEVKAIEDQPATAETADEGVPSNLQPAAAQNSLGAVPKTPATGDSDEDEGDEEEDEVPSLTARDSRNDLEAAAADLGINNPDDREKFPNKQSLVDAIEAEQE